MRLCITIGFVAIWAATISIPIATSMPWHLVPLPPPNLTRTEAMEETGGWRVVHILAGNCPCSRSVCRHLVRRPALEQVLEFVVVLGEADPGLQQLLADGALTPLTDGDVLASELGISGGPCLVILSPAGSVAYAGGYSSQPPSEFATFEDATVWQRVRTGLPTNPLPIFGCATTTEIRLYQDPLGLKRMLAK